MADGGHLVAQDQLLQFFKSGEAMFADPGETRLTAVLLLSFFILASRSLSHGMEVLIKPCCGLTDVKARLRDAHSMGKVRDATRSACLPLTARGGSPQRSMRMRARLRPCMHIR